MTQRVHDRKKNKKMYSVTKKRTRREKTVRKKANKAEDEEEEKRSSFSIFFFDFSLLLLFLSISFFTPLFPSLSVDFGWTESEGITFEKRKVLFVSSMYYGLNPRLASFPLFLIPSSSFLPLLLKDYRLWCHFCSSSSLHLLASFTHVFFRFIDSFLSFCHPFAGETIE